MNVKTLYTHSTNKENQTENDVEFQIGRTEQKCFTVKIHSATYQGDQRSYMEDAVVYTVMRYQRWMIVLCIVMDGHAGFSVVEFCKEHFLNKFKELLPRFIPAQPPRRGKVRIVVNGLKQIIGKCCMYCHESTRDLESGTTLSAICMLFDTQDCSSRLPIVVSANVGDSPIYGYRQDTMRAAKLSVDHCATSSKRERKRMEESKALEIEEDGYVGRDGNSLAMTRSIGDHLFGDEISAQPYVRHVKQYYDKYLLYSDGISDCMNIGAVLDQMRMAEIANTNDDTDEVNNVAEHILSYRNTRYEQHDNTSIIYVSIIQ